METGSNGEHKKWMRSARANWCHNLYDLGDDDRQKQLATDLRWLIDQTRRLIADYAQPTGIGCRWFNERDKEIEEYYDGGLLGDDYAPHFAERFGRVDSRIWDDNPFDKTNDSWQQADKRWRKDTDECDEVECDERGLCPRCGKAGEYRNVRKNHWFTCETCKVRWSGGFNLFSSWQDETQADWETNAEDLMKYEEVNQDGESVKTQSTPPETPELVAAGNADNPS